jgi:ABC-type transporter Mla subunit MlaD
MNPFKAVESLILGPPRLVVRTLDDFHTLVEIAADANKRLDRIERLATEMTQQLAILVKLVSVLEQGGETVMAAAKKVDTVARDVMSIGDRLDAGPDALEDLSVRFEEAAGQLQQRAKELADQGAQVAATVPILQRAMEVAGPSLEGALSRLGQFVAGGQPPRAIAGAGRGDDAGSASPAAQTPAPPKSAPAKSAPPKPATAKPAAAKPRARKPTAPKQRPAADEA